MAKWSKSARRAVKKYRRYVSYFKKKSATTFSPDYVPTHLEYKSFVLVEKNKDVYKSASQDITWAKRYAKYRKELLEKKQMLNRMDLDFYRPDPLPFRDYKEKYLQYQNDLKQEVEAGERKTIGNVNKFIVSDQAYELSAKQASSIFKYIQTLPEEEKASLDISTRGRINELMLKLRTGSYVENELGLWDKIREYRRKLFEQGYNSDQVRKMTSEHFFYPED